MVLYVIIDNVVYEYNANGVLLQKVTHVSKRAC